MGGHGDLCTSSKSVGAKLPGGAWRGRGLTCGANLSITVQRSPEERAAGIRQADSWAGPEGWTWAGCSSGVGSEVRFGCSSGDSAGRGGAGRSSEASPQSCRVAEGEWTRTASDPSPPGRLAASCVEGFLPRVGLFPSPVSLGS